jgi:hypothetical protein
MMAACGWLAGTALLMIALNGHCAHAAEKGGSPVPFPHPLMTEVLFAVPAGADGDANGDGIRSAVGDEFIELVNPHSKPISLKGYVLEDGRSAKARGGGARMRYVFQDNITLQPGQVAVVFNGYRGEDDKATGKGKRDIRKEIAERAKAAGSKIKQPVFLSMQTTSPYVALANDGDCVVLLDPKHKPVQSIEWGERDEISAKSPEKAAPLREQAPESKGSVTRRGLSKGLVAHARATGDESHLFSPGEFDLHPDKDAADSGDVESPVVPPEPDEAEKPATESKPDAKTPAKK